MRGGDVLSRYEVEYRLGSGSAVGKLRNVRHPELFEITQLLPQPRLFGLAEVLGDGWLEVLKLDGYAPPNPQQPLYLQEALFPYMEAL